MCCASGAKSVISMCLISACSALRVFYSVNATCNKAAVMKTPSAVASSSFDASPSSRWSLVFLLSLRMTTQGGTEGGREEWNSNEWSSSDSCVSIRLNAGQVWNKTCSSTPPSPLYILYVPLHESTHFYVYMRNSAPTNVSGRPACRLQKFCQNRNAKAATCDEDFGILIFPVRTPEQWCCITKKWL